MVVHFFNQRRGAQKQLHIIVYRTILILYFNPCVKEFKRISFLKEKHLKKFNYLTITTDVYTDMNGDDVHSIFI